MDKLTDKLNNISIHHAPTPKLLRSGKNRLENGNNQKIKKSENPKKGKSENVWENVNVKNLLKLRNIEY